jgi:hypothetical protein
MMESSTARTQVGLAAHRAYPGLALVLALLAIPGSTVAWELPMGGLWIGLPLALAALVLGLRARRENVGRGRATAAVVLAGLCIAQMVVWTAVSAFATDGSARSSASRTLTLTELERGATFTHIRNTKTKSSKANPQGDVLAFTNPLADSSGKRVGKLSVGCITTTGARSFSRSTITCHGVIVLSGGTLTVQTNVSPGTDITNGTITGGTGAYANVSGEFTSKQAEGGAVNTITLGS